MSPTSSTFKIQAPTMSTMSQQSLLKAHQLGQRSMGINVPTLPTRAPPTLRKLEPIKFSPQKVSSGTSPMSKSPEKEMVSKTTSPEFAGIRRSDADIQDLNCPITMEYMEDPVVASDGKTYERAAILDWVVRRNNPLSPVTHQRLKIHNGELVLFANENLRHIINGWRHGDFRDKACPEGYRFINNSEKELHNIMRELKINEDDEEKRKHFFEYIARYKPKKPRKRMSIFRTKKRGGTRKKKR